MIQINFSRPWESLTDINKMRFNREWCGMLETLPHHAVTLAEFNKLCENLGNSKIPIPATMLDGIRMYPIDKKYEAIAQEDFNFLNYGGLQGIILATTVTCLVTQVTGYKLLSVGKNNFHGWWLYYDHNMKKKIDVTSIECYYIDQPIEVSNIYNADLPIRNFDS